MRSHRLLTLNPDTEPMWVRLYVHQIEETWVAMIVADRARPPEPGSLKGLAFFEETLEDAERLALPIWARGSRKTEEAYPWRSARSRANWSPSGNSRCPTPTVEPVSPSAVARADPLRPPLA
jgi:hypothetical protein